MGHKTLIFLVFVFTNIIYMLIVYRLVCLRVHPTFNLLHPTESYVSFTSIDGSKREVWPESGEQFFEGDSRPDGKIP